MKIVLMAVAVSPLALLASSISDDFFSEQELALGHAKVDQGVLKLTDLEDLESGFAPLSLPGPYVFWDIDGGQWVASFRARFQARVGGGPECPSQGFSFVFDLEIAKVEVPFRKAGGEVLGLVVSFDAVAVRVSLQSATEGNEIGEALRDHCVPRRSEGCGAVV